MTDSLDRDPVVLLYDVARIMRTKFDQRARARGMTRAQWHILARVEHNPGVSQRELAAICEVEPITVARLVDRLEARGLLERRPDPSDRRVWRLHNLPAARPVGQRFLAAAIVAKPAVAFAEAFKCHFSGNHAVVSIAWAIESLPDVHRCHSRGRADRRQRR